MRRSVPKVATIQDLSGYGRCALTVAMPILSAMGVQVCPVPTVILSTHTGGFGKPVCEDLTSMLDDYIAHWESLNLCFDALYSGYLGNEEQITQVMHLFRVFKKEHTFTLVDPVMGDGGKLYSKFNTSMQEKMRCLVSVADIVTPNLTELYFLLGIPYTEEALTTKTIESFAKALTALGPKKVVMKGIHKDDGTKVNVAFDKEENTLHILPYEEVPMNYPGTGDAFASVLVGALLQGMSLAEATEKAASFVREGVAVTYEAGTDSRAGILIEAVLPMLLENRGE